MEPDDPTQHDPTPHDELEEDDEFEDSPHTALPPKMEAWRKRSAAGAILTGFALGLQEALETKREDPSIIVQTSGDPPKDLPVEAEFEYGRPKQSVVNVRPWLLNEDAHPVTPGSEKPPTHDNTRADDEAHTHDQTRADEDPGEP